MPIKLVSEKSEAEMAAQRAREAQERAREEVLDALVKMTGNLLRVVRGSGKPYEVSISAHEFLEAERALYDLTGQCLPSHEIANALNVFLAERGEPLPHDEEGWEVENAKHSAMKGTLQIAASLLLEDPLRVAAGKRELVQGLNTWEGRPSGTKRRGKSPLDTSDWRKPSRR